MPADSSQLVESQSWVMVLNINGSLMFWMALNRKSIVGAYSIAAYKHRRYAATVKFLIGKFKKPSPLRSLSD